MSTLYTEFVESSYMPEQEFLHPAIIALLFGYETTSFGFDYKRMLEIHDIMMTGFETLEGIGRNLVPNQCDLDKEFREHLDDPHHHFLSWHQWGIRTHSEKCYEFFMTTAVDLLKNWEMLDEVQLHMSKVVNKYNLFELFCLSIPFHDVGKYASCMNGDCRDHTGHEGISGELISNENRRIYKFLRNANLSHEEILYVSLLGTKHFELGKIRYSLRERTEQGESVGYNLKYINSPDFLTDVAQIVEENADIAIELGLWFLIDSLAKTDIVIAAESDEEIQQQEPLARALVEEKFQSGEIPSTKLTKAVLQRPVNITFAKRYLTYVLDLYKEGSLPSNNL